MRRFIVAIAVTATVVTGFAPSAWASESQHITIETSKAPGPVSGTFAATGAVTDSGAMNNLKFGVSAIRAPSFLVSHITILFTGAAGTFTLKTQITETATSDPNVLADSGTWTVVAGTGAYADLHGQGTVLGTVDDNVSLIVRTYHGDVHFS